jgi:hypothetical protein
MNFEEWYENNVEFELDGMTVVAPIDAMRELWDHQQEKINELTAHLSKPVASQPAVYTNKQEFEDACIEEGGAFESNDGVVYSLIVNNRTPIEILLTKKEVLAMLVAMEDLD